MGTIADSVDVVIWDFFKVENLSEFYNFADKALDNYMYIIMGYVAWRFKNKLVRKTALFLLVYRLIGSALFEITALRYLLFIFPNVFAIYFVVYTGLLAFKKRDIIKTNRDNTKLLLIVLIPKLIQEYIFHVAQFNVFRYITDLLS